MAVQKRHLRLVFAQPEVRWRTVMWVAMVSVGVMLGRPVWGEEGADDIFEAWRERAGALNSARFSWTEENVVQPGGFISPTDPESVNPDEIAFPSEEMTYTMQHTLAIAGEMMRYSYEGDRPHHEQDQLVHREYLSVYDGEVSKTFRAPAFTRPFAQGAILNEARNADVSSAEVEPLLTIYRVFRDRRTSQQGNVLPRAELGDETVTVNGRECRLLSLGTRQYWVDIERNWLIVRYVVMFGRGGMQRQVDIGYQHDPDHGWVPSEWSMLRFDRSGATRWSFDAKVTAYELNTEIPKSEFQFEFPVGTLVQDLRNRTQYEVQ